MERRRLHPPSGDTAASIVASVSGSDVIAAIATAHGRGGVGIVRVSGQNLRPLACSIAGKLPGARRATRATFIDQHGRNIDDGLVLYFPAPHSYTGEDVIELHGHGGPVVMRMLLARCLELGARLAEPGEFTRRAFMNDKLDLAQAEAVADLIDAATETSARCALRSLRGEFSQIINSLARELVELRMLVEATLDFPEDDIDPMDRSQARARLDRLRAGLARALDRGRRGSVLREGLTVVVAGRPNVGKSSLLNRLAGEELAIVTPIPGTTRDAVRQAIELQGVPIHVIDTAGLRDTRDEVEAIGIRRAWDEIGRADLALLVVDATAGVSPEDKVIMDKLPPRLERMVVHNKIDLAGVLPSIHRTETTTEVRVSAKTGEGLDLLSTAMLEAAGWQPGGDEMFMARERHLIALARASDCLTRAVGATEQTELFAEELRLAQRNLNTITGEFGADDLLGEIFGRFCIGK